jgi:eukaryotic-like serine/threonine-protein kinase
MPYEVPIHIAATLYPEYQFITPLTPSEQKAAFHVRDSDNNDLCLKIIAPKYDMDRLQREVLALQTINHINVAKLKVYEFSSKYGQQRHFMVEEFIHGDDLTKVMQVNNPMDLKYASNLFALICDGLSELSKHNIVHRDLKPSNIRVQPNNNPVIIDFGLARHLSLPDLTKTYQGAAIGTPLYFAPEQVSGTKRDIEYKTDLFTIGVIIYESVVGEHPFYRSGMDIQQLDAAILQSDDYLNNPKFLKLPSNWRLIISRLLEKERNKRPQSAEQVAKVLRKIGGE